ncbi:MAG: M23 family metallopeptidase [Leptonema sp. (in: bacteria)]
MIIAYFFIVLSLKSNQLETYEIELSHMPTINNFSDSEVVSLFIKEVKENIKEDVNKRKITNLKIYRYKVKEKEDFYYILAKSHLDHTTLISLNRIILNYSVEDFKKDNEILLSNHRGFFSSRIEDSPSNFMKINLKIKDSTKILYFYPGEKKLSLYHSSFSKGKDSSQISSKETLEYIYPINEGKITSFFGWRQNPITKKNEFHYGIDIQTKIHTPIYSPIEGTIIFVGYKKGYGNTIVLHNKETKEIFLFAHLSKFNVQKKQYVAKNTIIGYTGNTGFSTGPHLHLEYKKNYKFKNPLELFPKYL